MRHGVACWCLLAWADEVTGIEVDLRASPRSMSGTSLWVPRISRNSPQGARSGRSGTHLGTQACWAVGRSA